jgi:uncharacterized GH25 family protein
MKKILMSLIASMLLFATSASAVEVGAQKAKIMQMTTMSKVDAQALFGKDTLNVNTIKLDKGEMAQTEGESWFWFFSRINKVVRSIRIPEPPLRLFRIY